jgi:hypothetical protein
VAAGHRDDAPGCQHARLPRTGAPGFAAAVTALSAMTPVLPEMKVSALGTDAVVDGCLAQGGVAGVESADFRPPRTHGYVTGLTGLTGRG